MRTSAVWAVSAAVLVGAAVVLGTGSPADPVPPDGATLGPASGSSVAAYVAAAAADLGDAAGDAPRWALLAPDTELTPEQAAELATGTRTARVLLRVPVTDVQTPLLSQQVADQGDAAALVAELRAVQQQAGSTLASGGGAVDGAPAADRSSRIDALAGSRLRAGCPCIVGLLVRGTPDELRAVSARSGVRALQPAPEGAGFGQLALSPLLPTQTGTASPGRDDGEVPAG